jgi:hypothetical protein
MPSSGISRDWAQECLMVTSVGDSSMLADNPEELVVLRQVKRRDDSGTINYFRLQLSKTHFYGYLIIFVIII